MCLAKTTLAVTAKEAADCETDAQIELAAAGPARTACWLGGQAEAFASGHEMGQVLVWMIPLDASGDYPVCSHAQLGSWDWPLPVILVDSSMPI